jgi:hypothetical protein
LGLPNASAMKSGRTRTGRCAFPTPNILESRIGDYACVQNLTPVYRASPSSPEDVVKRHQRECFLLLSGS